MHAAFLCWLSSWIHYSKRGVLARFQVPPLFLGSSLCGACGFVDERNLRAVLASQGFSGAFNSVRCESPVGGGFAFEVVFNDAGPRTGLSTTLFHCRTRALVQTHPAC